MKFDIGFLGGGQLARMSIQAAQRMGLSCISLDPTANSPAAQVAPAVVGALDDPGRIAEIFGQCDRVTLENEFIPAEAIRKAFIVAGVAPGKMMPSVETLATIQDKLLQRHALTQVGVPSPKAVAITAGGEEAIAGIGFPMVLKARFGGYDGKGTRYARTLEEFEGHRDLWSAGGWLAEEFIDFQRELAVMVYISEWGAGCFPTMETVQRKHICDLVYPAHADASAVALAAVEAVGGQGLFGVELFETKDGDILVNEIAPRPHNTGHYTLDWGDVSQFEQHVRLVMGFPLETPSGYRPVCMANLVADTSGEFDLAAGLNAALGENGVHVHWYGKAEMRPGRKMGHINAVHTDSRGAIDRAVSARERFWSALTKR